MKLRSWAENLRQEVYKFGLEFIWHNPPEINAGAVCRLIKLVWNSIHRQMDLANIRNKHSLVVCVCVCVRVCEMEGLHNILGAWGSVVVKALRC